MDLILILFVVALPTLANIYISYIYDEYNKCNNSITLTGSQIARKILDNNNLNDIDIVEISKVLSDNYDQEKKTINLSKNVYNDVSISSASIAAHECGHAIQDKENYSFLRLRTKIYPITYIATGISYWIIVIGFALELINFLYFGIILTVLGLLFQLITLPVEFDASKKAIAILKEYNLVSEKDLAGTNKVLKAAALTYVAGTITSALQIIRFILNIFKKNNKV